MGRPASSPTLQVPGQVSLDIGTRRTLGRGGALLYLAALPRGSGHNTALGNNVELLFALLLLLLQFIVVSHVSLWDRIPSLQVDPAPAPALRHYFRHHRHRGDVGMGRGRGREVPLRQHVGTLPRTERQLGLQNTHVFL